MNKLLEKRLKCSFIMRSLHTLKIEEDQNLTPLHYINHVWVSLLLIWKYKSKKQQQICECRCTEYITIEYIYKYMFCRRKKKGCSLIFFETSIQNTDKAQRYISSQIMLNVIKFELCYSFQKKKKQSSETLKSI